MAELFMAADAVRMLAMLKGPKCCGKSRFVDHMAWRLGRPLITEPC
jgi:nitric oxide reductase NorQ protein